MELGWFACLLYGLVGGFAQFLPISEDAHSILFARLSGVSDVGSAVRFAVHMGALIALTVQFWPQMNRINRERRIAAIPPRRRKRQPDPVSLMDLSLLKTAAIPLLLLTAARVFLSGYVSGLWAVSLGCLINGIFLYAVEHQPRSTKDARNLSRLDGILLGLSGAFAAIPGISGVGAMVSTAHLRGADREYALQTVMLLSVPVMAVLLILDCVGMAAGGFAWLSFGSLLCLIAVVAGAAVSSYFGIVLMRFLAVKVGYTAFAFYSWGMALFTFILFLMI